MHAAAAKEWDPAGVKKWTLLKCLGSVCISMAFLVRSTLLLRPRPSLLENERERESKESWSHRAAVPRTDMPAALDDQTISKYKE